MSPFLSSSVLRAAALPRAAAAKRVTRATAAAAAAAAVRDEDEEDMEQQRKQQATGGGGGDAFLRRCSYDLFGVVSHLGEMSAGHYVAYVKAGGSWYRCDDPWVTLADEEAEVARCQAYMLFYGQRSYFSGDLGGAAGGLPGGPGAAAVVAAAKAANVAAGRGGA